MPRWLQQRMNAWLNRKIRGGRGTFRGMDVLILHTVGRRSGQPVETPLVWFADEDAWLVVASSGKTRPPDWELNLLGHPDAVSVELPGRVSAPVTPHLLDGAEREQAWKSITDIQPRYEKYQRDPEWDHPVIRLTPK